jgi:hypothetical protein
VYRPPEGTIFHESTTIQEGTMRTVLALAVTLTGAALGFGTPASAQDDVSGCWVRDNTTLEEAVQRSSPLRATMLTIGGQEAKLCYGSPSARERTVMGELVPMGEIWRLGANEATAIHLPFAAQVGGVDLEAGVYSIYAVPGVEEWEFVLSSHYERWGIPVNDEVQAAEVGRFSRGVDVNDEMVESLTFRWDSHGEAMGHLVMEWEHTRVEIPVHGAGHHGGGHGAH